MHKLNVVKRHQWAIAPVRHMTADAPEGQGGQPEASAGSQNNAGQGGQGQPDPRIQQLSQENATWRNKHKTAEQERDSWKQKFEETTTQLTTAQKQAQLKLDVILAAARTGFSDPEDALRFIDLSKLAVDDDKRVQAITDALKALGEGKPYLIKTQAAPAAPPPPQPSPANPAGTSGLTLAQINAMSDEEFAKHKDDILKFTASHRG